MTRPFFDQIDDEVRGLLGRAHPDFHATRSSQLFKLWYTEPWMHFEAQLVSARWGPRRRSVIEVGLHLESSSREQNDEVLDRLARQSRKWAKKLPLAEAGKALGPQSANWRRLSEVIDADGVGDPDLAGEVAERLSVYVKVLGPIIGDRK